MRTQQRSLDRHLHLIGVTKSLLRTYEKGNQLITTIQELHNDRLNAKPSSSGIQLVKE